MGKTQTENIISLQLCGVAILSGQAVWYIPAPPPQLLSQHDLIIIVITVTTYARHISDVAVEALKATPGNFINLKERPSLLAMPSEPKVRILTTPFLLITTLKYQTIAKFTKIPNTY